MSHSRFLCRLRFGVACSKLRQGFLALFVGVCGPNGISSADDAARHVEKAAVADSLPAAEGKAAATGRSMKLTVLGPDNRPLANCHVEVCVWTKEDFPHDRKFLTDEKGQVTFSLPNQIEILRVWANHEGHVGLFANWWPERENRPRKIPERTTFRLEKGTTIGGVVKNDQGEPIKGVQVQVMLLNPRREQGLDRGPIPNIWLAYGENARVTDEQGHWTLDNVPAGDEFGFQVMLNHADYISDYGWGASQHEQNIETPSFRDLSATLVMRRGSKLGGTVLDVMKRPVPDAVVIWGEDPYSLEGSQEVKTNEQGHYEFPPLPFGNLRITVAAPNFAPAERKVTLTKDNETADFQVLPGKTLRLLFVNQAGQPIPDVSVSISGWHGAEALYNHRHPNVVDTMIPVKSDTEGIYEWTGAPDDPVSYTFYKEGYQQLNAIELRADDELEHTITLLK